MGQKVHPTGIRLGIVKDWTSKWYADSKTFPEYVRSDHKLRDHIKRKLKDAGRFVFIDRVRDDNQRAVEIRDSGAQ